MQRGAGLILLLYTCQAVTNLVVDVYLSCEMGVKHGQGWPMTVEFNRRGGVTFDRRGEVTDLPTRWRSARST